MDNLNKTFCSLSLRSLRKEAKRCGVVIPHITTYCSESGQNPYYEVWAPPVYKGKYQSRQGIVWSGKAANANDAKSQYIEQLIDQHSA